MYAWPQVRVWCAVSYGLGSLIMGFVTDAFHNNFAVRDLTHTHHFITNQTDLHH